MDTQGAPVRRLAAPAAVIGALALLLWGLPWPCPIAFVLGIPCPSCGMTRAARAALSLDFSAATKMHPLWFVVLPGLALWLAAELGAYVARGRRIELERKKPARFAVGVVVALLICVWIARFFGAFGGPVAV